MRILYLTEESISFSDAMVRGGAIHVRNVVEGLRERGHEVHLVDWNQSPERGFQHSVTPRTRFVDGPLRTTRRAIDVARSKAVDVIISKTRKTYLPGLVAAELAGVPHVVHVGVLPDVVGDRLVDRVDAASLRTRLRAPHAGYLVVCQAIARTLTSMGIDNDRIFDVKNAIDTSSFAPDTVVEYPEPLHAAVNAADGTFRVGYVGGLYDYKGVKDLPPAVARADSDVRLILAGTGPEGEYLATALDGDVTLLGSIAYDQMPAVYDAIDALVLPSYTEGIPRVVLEAQAMKVPVIASRVGGVPEILDDRRTGLLVEPGDVGGIAEAIDELAIDSGLCNRLGENGRESVVEEWSWPRLYDRYDRHLETIVNGR